MKAAKGFTLIELLIVVIIMGIIGATAIPMISSNQDAQCAAAARALVGDLELAQSTALAKQANVALVFSGDLQSYKVVLADGQTLTDYNSLSAIAHPVEPGRTYTVNLASGLGLTGLEITAVGFGGSNRYVTFDGFGSNTSGGSVALKVRDAQLTVTVESITGAVSVN